jgi:hypothetical protein
VSLLGRCRVNIPELPLGESWVRDCESYRKSSWNLRVWLPFLNDGSQTGIRTEK